ncbi:MAG: 16S rRNA (guanine(527)-N(7))-methyltransferase RsmG [Chloroflexota bacterium]
MWLEQAEAVGIELTAVQQSQFTKYGELLLAWNQRINLTAVRTLPEIQTRHFLDSLFCATVMGELNGRSLIDIGTGAGFPGLPLKILYPELRLTLAESVGKKARFLETVVEHLGLEQVVVYADRAETLGRNPDLREQFDWATARAVAGLPTLVEYLLPFCRVGGAVLAQKGESAPEEVEAAKTAVSQLGGSIPTLQATPAKTGYFVTIQKVAPTPAKFPRRPGMPLKRPLGNK